MKKVAIHIRLLMVLAAVAMLATSCITSERVDYLQDMEHNSQIELENRFEATISPYDQLTIVVSSFDQSLAAPFNLNGGGTGAYLVDVNGDIQFPVLGNIHVAGMTRLQLQEAIATRLQTDNYIADPFVMVRFHNFKIFFLGADGGRAVTIDNERCTFLEALALSGDLSIYTRRDKIAVMREVNGKMTVRYLDPRSSKVFEDPFFMLQQNDFIITQSNNLGIKRSETSYWLGWVSTISSLTAIVVSFLTYFAVK